MPSSDLFLALRRLNVLLRSAVARTAEELRLQPGEDLFRGLYVEQDEALAAWDRAAEPAAPGTAGHWERDCAADPLFLQLAREFHRLMPADYAILLLALAPEFDPGYERVFGFLQDDVTRRRPTVGLALSLLDSTVAGRDTLLRRFSDISPLLAHRLIELVDPADARTGLLGKVIRPDEQYVRRAFAMRSLDSRLSAAASLTLPAVHLETVAMPDATRAALRRLLRPPEEGQRPLPLRLYLYGPDERAKHLVAEGVARHLGLGLLAADAGRLLALNRPFAETARMLAREARWFQNVLYLEGVEVFHPSERHREWAQLTAALAHDGERVILSGTRPALPPSPYPVGLLPLELPVPDEDARVKYWQEALAPLSAPDVGAAEVALLAERYALTRSQIEQAVAVAAARARSRGEASPTFDDLALAARAQGSYELESLTHRVSPRIRLKDLVVRPDVRQQLREIIGRVRNRSWVLGEWGFGHRHSYGNGVNALFAGPSGTGKTMAAEAIAAELGKDLYRIDLTAVVSKYIGETEQRLEQIFLAAEATQAVLFFDEADSLLGKRSEVRDAHDRYANIEVSYLLQRMERYDGLIVLATNLPGNLDDAFLRRMSAIVQFAAPGAADRAVLWRQAWPREVMLATGAGYEIDYDFLAERFELTGGGIRNAALAAAYAAADRPWFRAVTMYDVLLAVRRELQKLGQAITDRALGLQLFQPPPSRPPIPPGECPEEPYDPAPPVGANCDGGAR
jgi:SpoVK/Ycf46/Vps4 family AAA+-type ATPase